MATITLTFDTGAATAASITNDLADANGYNPATDGTKAAFAKECVRRYIYRTVRDYRQIQASQTAIAAVADPTLT